MGHKRVWILKQRPMPRVRVEDQSCVTNGIEHVVGIDRREHGIVTPVNDKDRLLDGSERFELVVILRTPRDDRGSLWLAHGIAFVRVSLLNPS